MRIFMLSNIENIKSHLVNGDSYTCLTLTLTLECKNICQYGVIVRSRSCKQATENYMNLELTSYIHTPHMNLPVFISRNAEKET